MRKWKANFQKDPGMQFQRATYNLNSNITTLGYALHQFEIAKIFSNGPLTYVKAHCATSVRVSFSFNTSYED